MVDTTLAFIVPAVEPVGVNTITVENVRLINQWGGKHQRLHQRTTVGVANDVNRVARILLREGSDKLSNTLQLLLNRSAGTTGFRQQTVIKAVWLLTGKGNNNSASGF